MNRRLPSFAALAMSAGLLIAACGDDDAPATPATEPATAVTEPMTDTTTMTDNSMTDDSMTDTTSNMEDTATTTTP